MSDKLTKAVEALRKKENDKLIKWEAEMIFLLEKYTKDRIMNELTDEIGIYEYVAMVIPKIDYKLNQFIQNWLDSSTEKKYTAEYIIRLCSTSEGKAEHTIKIKCLVNHITNIKNSQGYLEKEKLRKEQTINEEFNSDSETLKASEKKKEIQAIKKQISELQAKLILLHK